MSKRMVHEVVLKFFQDDATGEYGVSHIYTYDDPQAPFNAGWGALMIFHDVFEHWHEKVHPYFRGDYAMNVAGEMAAMGAMWYFYEEMGILDRLSTRSSIWSPSDNMRRITEQELEEACKAGYCRYGYTLESKIPKQKPVYNGELEYQIEEMWENVKGYHWDRTNNYCEDEKEGAITYKKSITFRKIADTHRWGFRMAERLVPNKWENREALQEFWDYFDDFTERLPAEDLYNLGADRLIIKIYKEKGIISWKAWIKVYGKEIRLTEHFYIDDLYLTEEEY